MVRRRGLHHYYGKHRSLVDICVGLVEGVGKRLREGLSVTKIYGQTIEQMFP